MGDKDSLVQVNDNQWSQGDKTRVLNAQKFLSAIGIFASIVLTTNLFLINKEQDNSITTGYGVVTILVTLLNILSLAWSLRQLKKTQNNPGQDGYETTDNQFTRFVLFITIIIYTTFSVFYVIYDFGYVSILNSYNATHDDQHSADFKKYVEGKQFLIDAISITNLLIGLFSTFSAYVLSSSFLTHRLMVFLFGIIALWLAFYQIDALRELKQTYFHARHNYTEWATKVIFGVSVASIAFLVLGYLVNHRKLRSAYMIIGALLLAAIAVQIPATGQLFRDYRQLSKDYQLSCPQELGKLDVGYVESHGCPNKYLYDQRPQCPNNLGTCFKPRQSCSNNENQIVWEKSLIGEASPSPVKVACINRQCCGVLLNTYGHPLLKLAAIGLAFLLYIFYLGVFTFQLSAKDTGQNDIHRSLKFFLWGVFLLILASGIIYDTWPNKDYLQRKGIVTNYQQEPQLVTVQRSEQLQRYLPDNKCEKFSSFFQRSLTTPFQGDKFNSKPSFFNAQQTPATTAAASYDPTAAANANNVVLDLGNLQKIALGTQAGTPQVNTIDNLCQPNKPCDGYILILATPTVTAGCKGVFQYNNLKNHTDPQRVRVISASELIPLINPTPPTTPTIDSSAYFGLIGDQQSIEAIINQHLNICGYDNSAKDNALGATCDLNNAIAAPGAANYFTVRVITVTLADYNLGKAGNVESTLEIGKLHKKIHHHDTTSTHGRHLAFGVNPANNPQAGTATTGFQKEQLLTVVVHSLIDDKPVRGAKVSLYIQQYNPLVGGALLSLLLTGTPPQPTYQQDCSTDYLAGYQPDFVGVTGEDGKLDSYFLIEATAQEIQFVIYVDKAGYNLNCRQVISPATTAGAGDINNIQRAGFFDVGISPQLEDGQTQVVLQWDKIPNNMANLDAQATNNKFDLDLWATFGEYSGNNQFQCYVGVTDDNCGGVEYHGDASTKKIGTTSEAITFKTLGQLDYLIFFERFYKDLPTTAALAATTPWVSDIDRFRPVLKYYSSESRKPYATNLWDQIKTSFPTPLTALDSSQKTVFLGFAIRGTQTGGAVPSERALVFKNSAATALKTLWTDATSQIATAFYADSTTNDLPSTQTKTKAPVAISVNGIVNAPAILPICSVSTLPEVTAP